MIPLIMAGVGLAANMAKGVAKRRLAKKTKEDSQNMKAEGDKMLSDAFTNLGKFETSKSLLENKQIAADLKNGNGLENAMKANADMGAGNIAGQIGRSSASSGQAAAGALVAEQQRLAGYNQASIAGAEQDVNAAQLQMGANSEISASQQKEFEYNKLMPFSINAQRGMNLENEGRRGMVESQKMRSEAFGDMMSGVSSAATAIGEAYGSKTEFDIKGSK